MHVGRHTTAQSAEIHSFGVHLSTWLTVGMERARMSWRNAPKKFFFPRYGVAHGRAQEPTPGSAVEFRGKSVRKNRPLVPRSNIAGSWTRGGGYAICLVFLRICAGTPPPLYKLRPCPSYSRRRDRNNCVRNFNCVQNVVRPHETWVCSHYMEPWTHATCQSKAI